MKRIVNGKVYDTDTAKFIGAWQNTDDIINPHYYIERLYKKRTGEYFLHCSGNADSLYSKNLGNNSWSGNSVIEPCSYAKAKKWAEENLKAEDFESEFGEITEDDSKRIVTFSISVNASEKLKRLSSESGVSASATIEALIQNAEFGGKNEIVGRLWSRDSIEIARIDGKFYALDGWNGEEYTKSWLVDDARGSNYLDDEYVSIEPIYEGVGEPDADGDYEQYDIVDFKIS